MSEERDCVVKLVDDHGVEHSVRVRTESAYEAAILDELTVEKMKSACGYVPTLLRRLKD